MSVKRVEVVLRKLKNTLPLPLQSFDSWMFVKENPDRKKLKKINSSHTFLLWYCFKGVLEAIHYAKVTVLISQHLLQACNIASSLSLIRKKLQILYLFEESNCSPAVIKVSIYSTSYCSNFCWQPPHSFMVTAKKRSFSLRNSSLDVTKSAVSCRFGHIYWRNP